LDGEKITTLANKITQSRLLLRNQYAYLDETGGYSALSMSSESEKNEMISKSRKVMQDPYAYLDEFGGFSADTSKAKKKGGYNLLEIEEQARCLQIRMWQDRATLWPIATPTNPIEILDPTIALKPIGYEAELEETLGQFYSDGKLVEVAGIIDGQSKRVKVSRQFKSNIRSFTAAHELGHALLHETGRMHRDRPINGETISRSTIEFEADKFATYFLMPRKLVQTAFSRIFLTEKFTLNEATAFALGLKNREENLEKLRTKRNLSILLASAEQFNGAQFKSLASQFKVSIGAMAIRLEELELLVV
jgi:Zn-dependent peptidase ImmA (M78 family)